MRSIASVIHGIALKLAIAIEIKVKINRGSAWWLLGRWKLEIGKREKGTSWGSSYKPNVSLSSRAAFKEVRWMLSFWI